MEISQDPGSIEHEQAPTGDFYAMPQQKGKKKGKNQVSSADPESADVAATQQKILSQILLRFFKIGKIQ